MNNKLFDLCLCNYDEKTYHHALRVVKYVRDDCRYSFYNSNDKELIDNLAIAHDLVEDTNIDYDDLKSIGMDNNFIYFLKILTHKKYEPYETYIKNIAAIGGIPFLVKSADIKDHLTQEDTLTSHLKNKYNKVLKYFL